MWQICKRIDIYLQSMEKRFSLEFEGKHTNLLQLLFLQLLLTYIFCLLITFERTIKKLNQSFIQEIKSWKWFNPVSKPGTCLTGKSLQLGCTRNFICRIKLWNHKVFLSSDIHIYFIFIYPRKVGRAHKHTVTMELLHLLFHCFLQHWRFWGWKSKN